MGFFDTGWHKPYCYAQSIKYTLEFYFSWSDNLWIVSGVNCYK